MRRKQTIILGSQTFQAFKFTNMTHLMLMEKKLNHHKMTMSNLTFDDFSSQTHLNVSTCRILNTTRHKKAIEVYSAKWQLMSMSLTFFFSTRGYMSLLYDIISVVIISFISSLLMDFHREGHFAMIIKI